MSISLAFPPKELREKFFKLQTRKDVANLLEVEEKRLVYHLYIATPLQKYKSFDIAKQSGATRRIDAPISALKIIQQKLNQVLSAVYTPKSPVHGFSQNKGIRTNAKAHVRQKFVLNVDLKDFFPSINFGRVRGLFMGKPYKLNNAVATVLAQICCFNNQLPQGAPTSPIVSNMICGKLDDELQDLARIHKCVYTRYADDISISTHRAVFPDAFAKYSPDTEKIELGSKLEQTILSNGFSVNPKKTRLQDKSRRQQVTGLIVNRKVNVKRSFINQIRAMLHAWERFGPLLAEEEYLRKYNRAKRSPFNKKPVFKNVVRGKIEYLGMVRGQNDPLYMRYFDQYCRLANIPNNKASQISKNRVLIPRIVTEGKTDWKHLKVALHKLQAVGLFPDLKIVFEEYGDDMPAGGAEIKELCARTARLAQSTLTIFIFDSDDSNIVKAVTEKERSYKYWGNDVFSFVIPVPPHRTETPEISIELYYKDTEITRIDKLGRRLFLSSEFRPRSGVHKVEQLNCTDLNKIRNERKLCVIDTLVLNNLEDNVALSKNGFASNILEQEANFHDLDYTSFSLIFQVVQQIIDEN